MGTNIKEPVCNGMVADINTVTTWGHIWIYSGETMPDWWPCQCGELRQDGKPMDLGDKVQQSEKE